MSLAKSIPERLNPCECKRTKLREPPPVPYIPEKDKVQEDISKLRQLQIKTFLEKDTTLNFAVWQENGTREAFLMHVTAVLDAIKKRGHFQDYDVAFKIHEEAAKAAESAEASLALLKESSEKPSKNKLKKLAKDAKAVNFKEAVKAAEPAKEVPMKAKEATNKAPAKAPESKPVTQEAVAAPEDSMRAGFQADLEQALKAQETAKGAMTAVATQMFAFYLNLLSPESKYALNKIVDEQTECDPYVNLQGVSMEGPRGMSHKSFNNCMMFHLLTAFPINAAEQEKYYITNVLKEPQRVNVRQFVRRVEQLNAYISQIPCFYYSPQANAYTKPKNVSFTEAELGAHVLHMCPIQWHDQFNLTKKGMTPMDMRSLLTLLEAVERICAYEKGKLESSEKPSHRSEKGKKHPGTEGPLRVPKKAHFEKHCNLCKKHGGAYTMHNTRECRRFEKDRKEKSDFRTAKKGGKKPYPVKHNFAQLTEKIAKLKKVLKKSSKKGKKRAYEDSDSDSE